MQNVDFVNTLMEMRNGKAVAEISKKYSELVEAIKDVGTGGEITLKLKLKPTKADMHTGVKEITVQHICTISKPERTVGPSVFFVGRDGRLSRTDPDQQDIFEEEEKEHA